MRQLEHNGARINSYDSYQEMVTRALGPSDMTDRRASRYTSVDTWSGGTWQQAETLGPIGDIASAKRLQAAIVKQANNVRGHTVRLDPVYRLEGGLSVDVARYLSGEPECWLDMASDTATRPARHANIVFNAIVSAKTSVSDYERVSVAIGGALLGLKSVGVPVSLYLAYANRGRVYTTIDAINMTGPAMSLDMAKLAAICQAWFFRRIIFSLWETYPAKFRKNHSIGGIYGHQDPVSQDQADVITGRKGTLVLNLKDLLHKSSQDIQAQILKTLYPKTEVTQ